MKNESEYREKISAVFDRIEQVFENVDPDIAECEQSQGAMILSFADGSRCILSAQPSVRQLWLALASKGTAYHFNFDPQLQKWVDDKGKGIELTSYLEKYIQEMTGIQVHLAP